MSHPARSEAPHPHLSGQPLIAESRSQTLKRKASPSLRRRSMGSKKAQRKTPRRVSPSRAVARCCAPERPLHTRVARSGCLSDGLFVLDTTGARHEQQ
jgi:hypothetical protein